MIFKSELYLNQNANQRFKIFMDRSRKVTIYDIAKKLDLNPSSVSRALNGSTSVKKETKERIIRAASELNYKKNSIAHTLRTGHAKTIGIIVPKINQNFFADVIAGIEQATHDQGYNIIICQSNESFEKEVQCVNMLIDQHVDCIVISISVESNSFKHLQHVIDSNIQLIQFDRVFDDLDTIKIINDNESVSYEAVCHMLDQGYKRIALLEGPQNLTIFRDRKKGYLKALRVYGIPVDENLLMSNAWTQELGGEATKRLLNMPEPPDAIFASTSDFSALGVLEIANLMNFKVPEQLGICGYSNENFTALLSPSMTTIDQFSFKIGKSIADLYFQALRKDNIADLNKIMNIQPHLIVRSSTLKSIEI